VGACLSRLLREMKLMILHPRVTPNILALLVRFSELPFLWVAEVPIPISSHFFRHSPICRGSWGCVGQAYYLATYVYRRDRDTPMNRFSSVQIPTDRCFFGDSLANAIIFSSQIQDTF
jgi:hypothetical protein